MSQSSAYPHIAMNPGVRSDRPTIEGTHIAVHGTEQLEVIPETGKKNRVSLGQIIIHASEMVLFVAAFLLMTPIQGATWIWFIDALLKARKKINFKIPPNKYAGNTVKT